MLGRARHRLDDARRALVEFANETLEPLLAQQLRRLLALLRHRQLLGLAAAELEDVERARHLAHLVPLAEEWHLDIELAIGQVVRDAETSPETLQTFLQAEADARFLFGLDVLKELRSLGSDFEFLHTYSKAVIDDPDLPN